MKLDWIREASGISDVPASRTDKPTARRKAVQMMLAAGVLVSVGVLGWFTAKWTAGEAVEFVVTLLLDTGRGTLVPVSKGSSGRPVWALDGRSVVFNSISSTTSNPGSGQKIVRKWIDGSEREETLISSKNGIYPDDWSRDGRWLLYEYNSALTNIDLFLLPMEGDRTPQPYLRLPGNQTQARISPDGRWVAYSSDESGKSEVYVQSFPKTGGGKCQISTRGGDQPFWRGDGRELFFISHDQKLMSVEIKVEPKLEPGIPKVLFQTSTVDGSPSAERN